MNQSRAFLTSMIFAGVAMLLVFFYVNDKESAIKSEFGTDVTVVVAARDINEFEQIQANMLSTVIVPKKFSQPGSVSDPSVFLTSGSVAAAPIRRGEQILLTKVLLKGAETGLSTQVGISKRALSIPVSDVTGVTKLIKPGDRVDVIANIGYQAQGGQISEVKTIMQDIQVLAVGEVIQNQIPSVFEEDPLTSTKRAVNLRGSRAFSTVTLEVAPLEAQALIYTIEGSGATLYLTLRNPVDRVLASIPTTTVDEVLGSDSKKSRGNRPSLAAADLPATPRVPASLPPPPAPNPFSLGGGSFVK